MTIEIPTKIGSNEILVRFIFDRNFKNKVIDVNKLIIKNIFLPNKGGVSLQRGSFLAENQCKSFAKKIPNRKFAGFLIFKKYKFEEIKVSFIQENSEFDAKIIATPLDINGNYILDFDRIFINDDGNPTHADIKYFKPEVKEEVPNPTIRSFSRKLSKICAITLEENGNNDEIFYGKKFSEII